MKRSFFTIVLILVNLSILTAQDQTDNRKWYQDPRMMNIGPVGTNIPLTQNPVDQLNYVNPNTSVMVQKTIEGSAIVYPNFRVHPSTRTQSETPIVTHPSNKNIMYGSANAGIFSPLFISEGVYVTTNGGTNWFGNDTTMAAPITDHGGDPAPSIDLNGRFYQSYLSLSGAGLWVTNSIDNGNTWAAAIKIITGSQDKNHTVTINNPSSPYNGRTLVTWSRFTATLPPIAVSYTANNGTSWSTSADINVPAANHYSQGCNGAVAPNGDVYVCWQNPNTSNGNIGDYVGFAKSINGGVNWTYNNNVYDCNGIRGTLKSTAIRVNDFPWMAVDKSGGSRNGWIYIVTAEKNLSPAGSDPDITLHRSIDGGSTWSGGIRVNQDALNNGKEQYMPCIIVDGTGAVNVVYYDNRNCGADSTQVYISRSVDGGTTWSDIQVSDHTFKPTTISGAATGYQGDYIGITEGLNGTIWPYWADNISGIYQAWTTKVSFATNPLNAYNLNLPAAGSTVTSVPNGIGSINFTWDTSSSTATYKWTFGSPTISTPKIVFTSNTNSLSLNSNQLDILLAALGVNQGDSLAGQWQVMAYRNNPPANDSLQASNGPRSIYLKRGLPQLLAFNLNSPADHSTIVTSILNNSNLVFNWRKSGDGVKYKYKFGTTLSNPAIDILSGSGGYDTSWITTYSSLDLILQNAGLVTGDSISGVWAAYGFSGTDSLKSVQSFNLILKRQAKGEFLIAYDSTQTNGIISRDSVINNLNLISKTYELFNKGSLTSTSVISFRGYKHVIWLGEATSVMSNVQKDSLKAYLNSGNTNGASKSRLIIFSEDVGYQLDQSGTSYTDTAFTRGMLGFQWILDRPASGANQAIVGDVINSGLADSTVGLWPDVLKISWLGGKRLYKYKTLTDSACAVGRIGDKWNTAIYGVDVRSLRRAFNSPAGSPVMRLLRGAIGWVDSTLAQSVNLSLTARIQGFTNSGTGLMVPDTISCIIKNGSSPYTTVDSIKLYLNSNGQGAAVFSKLSLNTNYYLKIKHRNAIETWSNLLSFATTTPSYDFTTVQSQAYGNNMVLKGSKWCLYSGDVNQDGLIDSGDLGIVDNDNANYVSGYVLTDVNGDGLVDSGDLGLVDNNNAIYIGRIVPAEAPTAFNVKKPLKANTPH